MGVGDSGTSAARMVVRWFWKGLFLPLGTLFGDVSPRTADEASPFFEVALSLLVRESRGVDLHGVWIGGFGGGWRCVCAFLAFLEGLAFCVGMG